MADLPKTPMDRKELFLSAAAGQTSVDNLPEPVDRKEEYLDYIARNITGGGGGGATNYNNLTNKPSINDVTLQGNKTLSELGIYNFSETTLFSNSGTTNPEIITLPQAYTDFDVLVLVRGNISTIWQHVIFVSQIAEGDILSFTTESDGAWINYELVSGTYLRRTNQSGNIVLGKIVGVKFGASGNSDGGTTNYDLLTNKPSIAGVTLTGDKSLEELGAASTAEIEEIKSAIDVVEGEQAEILDYAVNTGVKNILKPTLSSRIQNGLEFVVGDDYSITVTGTATNTQAIEIGVATLTQGTTYYLSKLNYNGNSNLILRLGSTPATTGGNIYKASRDALYNVALRVVQDDIFNNFIFYPMVQVDSIKNRDYVPYAEDNGVLTAKVETLIEKVNELLAMQGLDIIQSNTANLQSFTPKLTADVMDEPLSAEDVKGDIGGESELTENEPIDAELTVEKEPLTAPETELRDGLSVEDEAEPNAEDGETG